MKQEKDRMLGPSLPSSHRHEGIRGKAVEGTGQRLQIFNGEALDSGDNSWSTCIHVRASQPTLTLLDSSVSTSTKFLRVCVTV